MLTSWSRLWTGVLLSLSHSPYTICNVLYQYNTQNQCIFFYNTDKIVFVLHYDS
jgi:hypothetical protein